MIGDALSRPPIWFNSNSEWKARSKVEIGLPEAFKLEGGMYLMEVFQGKSGTDKSMLATVQSLPKFLDAGCKG